jgi:hypothetical protein
MSVSPVMQRLAAVTLLLALLGLAWSTILGPIIDGIATDRESIDGSRQLLARYDRLAAELPTFEKQLAEIRASETAKGFLEGTGAAMLAAKLQGDVQRIAAGAGVALRSSQTLAPQESQDPPGFTRIGLKLELGAPAAGLQRLLHGIETATPALFVDKLSVRVPESGATETDADGQPVMTIRVELSGIARRALP